MNYSDTEWVPNPYSVDLDGLAGFVADGWDKASKGECQCELYIDVICELAEELEDMRELFTPFGAQDLRQSLRLADHYEKFPRKSPEAKAVVTLAKALRNRKFRFTARKKK